MPGGMCPLHRQARRPSTHNKHRISAVPASTHNTQRTMSKILVILLALCFPPLILLWPLK